jgi:hypothetical protein
MATKLFSFSLCDDNDDCPIVTKVTMYDKRKWETMTMGCYFTKCGNITMMAFGIGGNGSKLCVAEVASYYSSRSNYGKKTKKKIHLKAFANPFYYILANFHHKITLVPSSYFFQFCDISALVIIHK